MHQQVEGEVLVSFELTQDRRIDKIPRDLRPKMQMQWMHIITLGLRDIQSLLGVHKPFIEFEVNGIIYQTEHSNIPSARNPNFNQILHFRVELPVNPLFMPSLNVTIKDAIGGGIFKRQIGYASVDLDQHMRRFEEEEKELKHDISDDGDGSGDDDNNFMDNERENIGLLSGIEDDDGGCCPCSPFKRKPKEIAPRTQSD